MLKTKYTTAYLYASNHGGFIDCKHNCWVDCVKGAECKNCGWNPEVSEKRKSQLFNRKVDGDE